MNREAWQHIVQEARNGNDALFNKAVTSNFQEYFSLLRVLVSLDLDLYVEGNQLIESINPDDLIQKDIYL